MRVLVTGGAGFIGSHVVDVLARHGHEPVVFDAVVDASADVRVRDAVTRALDGADAVCRQAAMVGLGSGAALSPGLVEEDAPVDPRSVYATTKLAQEHLAAARARSTGGTAVSLRYDNVYGPRMPRDTPYAGVASFFRSPLARRRLPGCSRTAVSGGTSSMSGMWRRPMWRRSRRTRPRAR